MASKTYLHKTVDGKTNMATRSIPQGRRPQGFRLWKGRLSAVSLAAIEAEAARLGRCYSVNQIIRDAVDRYVGTELVKP